MLAVKANLSCDQKKLPRIYGKVLLAARVNGREQVGLTSREAGEGGYIEEGRVRVWGRHANF